MCRYSRLLQGLAASYANQTAGFVSVPGGKRTKNLQPIGKRSTPPLPSGHEISTQVRLKVVRRPRCCEDFRFV
ncbi:unnamed protein product [Protopolystoma xenopodis]|uniref:Uncharacterized protein n=1 Tax=Protopolystoma xenopodis TaxID=117903 RepID=A0A448WKN1_9PLAT|nr:unnamed protein product [Protopolystoma xenopodis]